MKVNGPEFRAKAPEWAHILLDAAKTLRIVALEYQVRGEKALAEQMMVTVKVLQTTAQGEQE